MTKKPPAPTAAPDPRPYHHGDLPTALLTAAEQELSERGVEGFSLRGVAKRAGVSHAAPAHHFRDVNGLLTELAALGFERLMARQRDFRGRARPGARDQIEAMGLGYVAFATENPALFRLMFGSQRPELRDERLLRVARGAFDELVTQVGAVTGNPNPPSKDRSALTDVAAAWAAAHGLADLLAGGRLPSLAGLPASARAKVISEIVGRALAPAAPAAATGIRPRASTHQKGPRKT
jgi:AcrR family transcriptional regulator